MEREEDELVFTSKSIKEKPVNHWAASTGITCVGCSLRQGPCSLPPAAYYVSEAVAKG